MELGKPSAEHLVSFRCAFRPLSNGVHDAQRFLHRIFRRFRRAHHTIDLVTADPETGVRRMLSLETRDAYLVDHIPRPVGHDHWPAALQELSMCAHEFTRTRERRTAVHINASEEDTPARDLINAAKYRGTAWTWALCAPVMLQKVTRRTGVCSRLRNDQAPRNPNG
jgi:hypothetical protein